MSVEKMKEFENECDIMLVETFDSILRTVVRFVSDFTLIADEHSRKTVEQTKSSSHVTAEEASKIQEISEEACEKRNRICRSIQEALPVAKGEVLNSFNRNFTAEMPNVTKIMLMADTVRILSMNAGQRIVEIVPNIPGYIGRSTYLEKRKIELLDGACEGMESAIRYLENSISSILQKYHGEIEDPAKERVQEAIESKVENFANNFCQTMR